MGPILLMVTNQAGHNLYLNANNTVRMRITSNFLLYTRQLMLWFLKDCNPPVMSCRAAEQGCNILSETEGKASDRAVSLCGAIKVQQR